MQAIEHPNRLKNNVLLCYLLHAELPQQMLLLHAVLYGLFAVVLIAVVLIAAGSGQM